MALTMSAMPIEFEQQVRDCLLHLYDYAFLQSHPLVELLAPNTPTEQRVQAFRELIFKTIENFRPGTKSDFHTRHARAYNILTLRYVEDHDILDVQEQMALSERQFYREHRRAIEAVSRALWEKYAHIPETEAAVADGQKSLAENIAVISVQSE